MNKTAYLVILLLAMIATACSSPSKGTNPASVIQNGAPTGALPATTQLILGTLKLEDTDQAVTAKQAAELLLLWQTFQALSSSDTVAQQEKDALIAQIQETMTAEQMQAITAMNLTRQDMFTVMQEQGVSFGAGNGQNTNRPNSSSSGNGGRNFGGGGGFQGPPNGEVPGGGAGGGFGGGQGQNLSPEQIATAQAARQQGGGNFVPTALVNALIDSLQKKIGS